MRVWGRVREVRIRGAVAFDGERVTRAAGQRPGRRVVLSLYARTWPSVGAGSGAVAEQAAHERMIELLRRSDGSRRLSWRSRAPSAARRFPDRPTRVGGVTTPDAAHRGGGLRQGRRLRHGGGRARGRRAGSRPPAGLAIMPALVGAVELGSYTRQPRLGNSGPVRLARRRRRAACTTASGLRNPGAAAAAALPRARRGQLPGVWGVNLAVSPGVDDPDESATQLREAATSFERAFAAAPRRPATLPTPRAGPPGTRSTSRARTPTTTPPVSRPPTLARRLAAAVAEVVSAPLWVKVGPDLSATQYDVLVDVLVRRRRRARSSPRTRSPGPGTDRVADRRAGRRSAPRARARGHGHLGDAIARRGSSLDIVGSRRHPRRPRPAAAFQDAGAKAAMVYSALVFRGPLAPALILREARAPAMTVGARPPSRRRAGRARAVARALIDAGGARRTSPARR